RAVPDRPHTSGKAPGVPAARPPAPPHARASSAPPEDEEAAAPAAAAGTGRRSATLQSPQTGQPERVFAWHGHCRKGIQPPQVGTAAARALALAAAHAQRLHMSPGAPLTITWLRP